MFKNCGFEDVDFGVHHKWDVDKVRYIPTVLWKARCVFHVTEIVDSTPLLLPSRVNTYQLSMIEILDFTKKPHINKGILKFSVLAKDEPIK